MTPAALADAATLGEHRRRGARAPADARGAGARSRCSFEIDEDAEHGVRAAHRARAARTAARSETVIDTRASALSPEFEELQPPGRASCAPPASRRSRSATGEKTDRRADACSAAVARHHRAGAQGPRHPALQGPRRDEPGAALGDDDEPGDAHAAAGERSRTPTRPTRSSRRSWATRSSRGGSSSRRTRSTCATWTSERGARRACWRRWRRWLPA